jgi:Protein of unknown function (DUF1236)
MKYHKTALLAGVSAMFLFAGITFAPAQENSKGESGKGAAPHTSQQMNQPGGHPQNAQTQQRGSMSGQGQRTEDNRPTKGEKSMNGEENRAVQSNEKKGTTGSNEPQAGKAAEDHMNHGNTAQDRDRDRNKNATESERPNRSKMGQDRDRSGKNDNEGNRGSNTANDHQNRMEGAHAATGNVQLNEQQRTEIRTTVINAHGAPRVDHVDFDVTVGAVIPRERIHVVAVPETLVQIEPEWRDFLYFVYEDEVVIVDPDNMRIVAVIPA